MYGFSGAGLLGQDMGRRITLQFQCDCEMINVPHQSQGLLTHP